MTIAEAVKKIISDERAAGHTLQQIADKFHIPQPHVANLLNHRRTFEGITLGTFAKMFPRAEVFLDGAPGGVTQTVGDNSAAAIGDNNTVSAGGNTPAAEAVAAFRQRLSNAILDLDIPGEATRAVLRVIRDTQ